MKELLHKGLDAVVDKLTNSIKDTNSGKYFQPDISIFTAANLSNITKRSGWHFDWKYEFKQPGREVYKLTILNNPTVIHGLMSIQEKSDHLYIPVIESASFNKGNKKLYSGIPGTLVAFACKLSIQKAHEGNVAFISKPQLFNHYAQTLGALNAGGRVMVIETQAALKLIDTYFKKLRIMQGKTKELNVDFIGGGNPLTYEEEKIISEFIKTSKSKKEKINFRTSRSVSGRNATS